MNEQVQRHLDAEAASDSRGYVSPRPLKEILTAADGGPGTSGLVPASGLEADVDVSPLAGVAELLHLARSQQR